MLTPAFEHLDELRSCGEGTVLLLFASVENDYYKEVLPTIPAGTWMRLDFAFNEGLYATADVRGVLHRVKIKLEDIHHIRIISKIKKNEREASVHDLDPDDWDGYYTKYDEN